MIQIAVMQFNQKENENPLANSQYIEMKMSLRWQILSLTAPEIVKMITSYATS